MTVAIHLNVLENSSDEEVGLVIVYSLKPKMNDNNQKYCTLIAYIIHSGLFLFSCL